MNVLLRLELDGHPLIEMPSSRDWIMKHAASPDGRYLAYGVRTNTEDFWILEGL